MRSFALCDPKTGSVRIVFIGNTTLAIVVKLFKRGGPIASVKVWDTNVASLDKTISYWKTNQSMKIDQSVVDSYYKKTMEILVDVFDPVWNDYV